RRICTVYGKHPSPLLPQTIPTLSFFFSRYRAPPHLPSFPTRRSSDLIAAHVQVGMEEKQYLLETFGPAERLTILANLLDAEIERSEEHTSELHDQISYAVFCLKKKNSRWAAASRCALLRSTRPCPSAS